MRSKRRLWLYRVTAATLAPLIFLGVLEFALRLGGYGYPTTFFIDASAGRAPGRGPLLRENDRFGWRFFPRALARSPLPTLLRERKPEGAVRVFVLGGSAAKGEPAPEFAFARVLDVLLAHRRPDLEFEIINCGVTAVNSHIVLPIAREAARLEGDFWVVYMGNNEVIGPFGPGTAFGARSPDSRLLSALTALRTTRSGQLLEALLRRPDAGEDVATWRGMEMFIDHEVRRDDPRMEVVYSCFADNLGRIVESGRASGAQVILSTVATNLRDCAPFASVNSTSLTGDEHATWKRLYKEGAKLQAAGESLRALDPLQAALEIDAGHGDLHFRIAACYEALGRLDDARKHYTLARDLDTLRFRADSPINDAIRQCGGNRSGQGVHLVDMERLLAGMSPEGLPGREFFYEHVHFNFEGNYVLGRSFAEKIADLLPDAEGRTVSGWLDINDCARRLALTPWDRLRVTRMVRRRLGKPPYSGQLDHPERDRRLESQIEEFSAFVDASGFERQDAVYREAVERCPDDWVVLEQQGSFLAAYGEYARSEKALKRALELVPHHVAARYRLGAVYAYQGAHDEAERCFREVAREKPWFFEGVFGLGLVLAGQDRHEEARGAFARALAIRPEAADAHRQIARSLQALNRQEEAEAHLREAARLQPDATATEAGGERLPGAREPPLRSSENSK